MLNPMLNPWFAITFQAARLGFEAQNAAALQLMRLVGGTSKTEVRPHPHAVWPCTTARPVDGLTP